MKKRVNFNYLNRDFYSLVEDLKTYVKTYYPEDYNDFSTSSIGMMLLEINAYVGDILSYHTDKNFKELFIDHAQNRSSIVGIAKNLGYRQRGRSPAVTLLDVNITIPVKGDTYDEDYLITIEKGMRAGTSQGQTFEILEDIEFSQHTSLNGIKNRTIVPNYNASNEIVNYTITKQVPAIAGITKTTYLEVTENLAVPFMKWYPDTTDFNISEVLNVVSKSDRFTPTTESEWDDSDENSIAWFEVDSLPQERVFVDTSVTGDSSEGYWKYTDSRFITEYDENGILYLTFGAGIKNTDLYENYIASGLTNITKASILNNDSLGIIPQIGTYMHIRYRSGGGKETNCAMNTITNVLKKNVSYIPGGSSLPISNVNDVLNSVRVNNPVPALGGRDFETSEELKINARHHFSSQDRCVTVDDYISRTMLMPAKYGSVFRAYAEADPESMNTNLYILTRDENGRLKNTGNDTVKFNLAAYLKQYKVLNDFVRILDGRIINLGLNFTIQVLPAYNKNDVIVNSINVLKNYFSVENWQMNNTIFISQINELLRQQPGVINVVNLQFYNKVGNGYSNDILAMNNNIDLSDLGVIANYGQVPLTPVNNSIKAPITGMFEFKYPEKDFRGSAIS